MPDRPEPQSITAERRAHILKQARKLFLSLKRRGLIAEGNLWPDESPRIVAALASYACDMHAYLKRCEKVTR